MPKWRGKCFDCVDLFYINPFPSFEYSAVKKGVERLLRGKANKKSTMPEFKKFNTRKNSQWIFRHSHEIVMCENFLLLVSCLAPKICKSLTMLGDVQPSM